jgi:bacillithiol biosynthesis cysteine-adding enzyme BshC
MEEVEGRLDARARQRVATAIEPLGDAAGRLGRILAGDGFFVTTGQQPALFGGPLYTLYKILGAIRLADRLERESGRPVLALFWVGSDDHDWDEANHSAVLDRQDYVQRIEVPAPDGSAPLPLGIRTWGRGVLGALDELAAALPDTVHAREVMTHVRTTYLPDSTVAASSTATLRWLLADRRVAFVDSGHAAVRQAAAGLLAADAARVLAGDDPVARQTARLEADGYAAQVAVESAAANIMLIDEHGRDRIVRTSRGWTTRRSRTVIGDDDLPRLIESEPERFSPNVMLRPVVESALFPTVAYVAGPGELSYFAQLGCLFEWHGILPPVVVPRPSVTLLPDRPARMLERLGLEPADLQRPFRDVVADAIAREMPAEVTRALEALRAAIHRGYDALDAAAADVDPTLHGPIIGARNASLLETNAAARKISAGLRRTNHVQIEQLRRLSALLQPGDAPQERVLGALPFIAEHGRGLVARIEAALDMDAAPRASWSGPDCR